jgi:hypothetical protein
VEWSHTTLTCFAAIERSISEIAFPSFSAVRHWGCDGSKAKPTVSMTVSPNDHFLIFRDSAGIGHYFSLAAEAIVAQHRDWVNRVKFVHAIFDRPSAYVIVGAKAVAAHPFRIFRVEDGTLVRRFPRHREPMLQLLSHPLDAVIFACCRSGIVKWESTSRWCMKHNAPQFGLIQANVDLKSPKIFSTFSRRMTSQGRCR